MVFSGRKARATMAVYQDGSAVPMAVAASSSANILTVGQDRILRADSHLALLAGCLIFEEAD